ncbi:DUF2303 family protein [Catenovulum sediminis]|uniref:DUF2303 family protein n=1 Tax=Catenovulum sediminis TaxID=1740262 RepID=UPI00117FC9CD|nr:DUF2303 family protein [Catenovulum sediminis]
MSMDQSAILQIQKSETSRALNGDLLELVDNAAIAVPNDFSIKSIEQYQPTRQRFRGKFNTLSLDAFTDYVAKKAKTETNSTVFIDDIRMTASCIFDLGGSVNPLHCEHKAHLDLPRTAPYRALLEFNGETLTQSEFAEFLEDWRHNIKCFDILEDEINVIAAIARVRKITIDSARSIESDVQNFSSSASAMERVETRNAETLPATILFCCIPYAELEERVFELRISLKTGGTQPMLVARVIGFEAVKEELAEEFKNVLDDKLTEAEVHTFIGTFSS